MLPDRPDPEGAPQLQDSHHLHIEARATDVGVLRPANVSSVPNRSPFRYPGGKTWLVPYIRRWLDSRPSLPREFVEPFAGGGIVGLTVAFERLADHVTMVEKDEDVAAVWRTILDGSGQRLAERITTFDLTAENVRALLSEQGDTVEDQAFRTIVRNRINRAGILARRAGKLNRGEKLVTKAGEKQKGLKSRWYPETLRDRVLAISEIKERIAFIEGDGLQILEEKVGCADTTFFIDPPYAYAGAGAGRRLYRYFEVDHAKLFDIVATLAGDFLVTYDEVDQVKELAASHGFDIQVVEMKTAHNVKANELLIGRDLDWARN